MRILLDDVSSAATAQWTKQLLEDPKEPIYEIAFWMLLRRHSGGWMSSLFKKKHLTGYGAADDQSHCMRSARTLR
jgi:hypothetical protein